MNVSPTAVFESLAPSPSDGGFNLLHSIDGRRCNETSYFAGHSLIIACASGGQALHHSSGFSAGCILLLKLEALYHRFHLRGDG